MVALNAGSALTTNLTFYDPVGNTEYTVDARGALTQYQYDASNRRTNVVVYTTACIGVSLANPPSPSGPNQSTSYTYDGNGNQLTVTDAAGNTTTSHYDSANRVFQVDYPAETGGIVSRYTYYDGLGRKLQENDEAGVATAYTYDFRGLLLSVTLAAGTPQQAITVYTYDELGNEITQADTAGHTTTFQYDALGRRIGRTLPGGQQEGFAYDVSGNPTNHTTFSGVVITNFYDVDNRLTNCSAPGYQAIYAYSPTGLRTNMVDASGTTAYYYNSLSELTNKTVKWNGQPQVALNYLYDALGCLTNLWCNTPNGVSNAYQYDILGRITNVTANGTVAAGYGYDVVGNLQSLRYANGVTNLYQYDARNRLTRLAWNSGKTVLGSFAYTVGPTGNRTALTETVGTASRTCNWAYDYLYRMTGETFSGTGFTGSPSITYGFDAVGNRTNRTSGVSGIGGQTPTYNANDWLASDSYDLNGNTTNSDAVNYQYDALNHLISVNRGYITITYDGDGNRVSKYANGMWTYYLVDSANPSGYAQVLEEYQGTDLSRVYNYGLTLISQRQVSSGTISYFGSDGHGSTRFLTDVNGNITDSYTFDAYGLLLSSTGTTTNNYLYCGQHFDTDLGFYYLRARYYKPDSGRFWTMDTYDGTSEDPLSLHKYLYCQADPVDRIDPSGLASYVGFDTVGWNNYGHVGIITHNPATGIYTEFDHAHGIVSERKSTSTQEAFKKTDNYGVVFIIPDQYDAALDTARQNFKKHPGGSTIENNCLTSVIEIFKAAKVPYPDNGPIFPNMWLTAFYQANYGYILLKPAAGTWIMKTVYGPPSIEAEMISVTVESGGFY
jgi:RHS repeat-associated protein